MNDSHNGGSEANNQTENKPEECCSGGSCCSPMQSLDWKSINDRAKAVLTDPKNVWPTIKNETKSIKEVYITYLIPLSVLGALCGLLGSIVFGGGAGFVTSIIGAIVGTVFSLGLMFVNAHVYKLIAPYFQGKTDETATFKLMAYGSTASLVGAFLSLFPPLGILGILFSIYTLYTIYQGIPVMTGVTEKRLPYFIVCVIATIITGSILGFMVAGILGLGAPIAMRGI